MKTDRPLLKRSCAWLAANWNPTNLDVPDELLVRWVYPIVRDGDADDEPQGFHLAVFMFGYMQYERRSRGIASNEPFSVSTSQILESFQTWQLKLALTELHRNTPLRVAPTPLFHFSPEEQIEVHGL